MNQDPERPQRIVRCRWMPKRYCLNFFGIVLTRDTGWINSGVVNHERIHTAQQRELLWIPFYILYIMEWIVRLIQFRNHDRAYRNISFEREAYTHGGDFGYLRRRKRHSWLRHLFYTKQQLEHYEQRFR
ncbi:MAG: hypothetical protein K2K93_06240 [Muribaculaceae bacterium]|nr:hypothetical protein [Muribaculaceae bacterium]